MEKGTPFLSVDSSNNNSGHLVLIFFLFLVSSFFAYFFMLTAFPVQLWDEGMFAVQGIEMMENNNWLIQYFNGVPDRVNNKPPLSIWFIALSFKIFGINEFALRLPSALFGFFTSITLFYFVWKYSKNILFGLIAALVLNTSIGFIGTHISKTGEADAILTFFVTIFLLAFFLFMETEDPKKKRKYFLIFTLCLTLASLTKSISALLVLPGILMYILIKGKLCSLLQRKEIYFSILFFLLVNVFYYLLREYYDPGNFRLVWERDILTRYFDNLGHQHPFFTYIENLINKRYVPWIFIVPVSAFLLFFNDRYKNIALYLTLNFIAFLLIISCSGTKLEWYDEFLYPMGSIIIGFAIGSILEKSILTEKIKIICCCLIFAVPFNNVIRYGISLTNLSQEEEANYNAILYMVKKEQIGIKGMKVFYKYQPSNLLFYKKVLEDSVFKFTITENINEFNSGSTVVVCNKSLQRSLVAYCDFDILYFTNGCFACKIIGKRNNFLERKYMLTKQEIVNNPEWKYNIEQKAITNGVPLEQQLTEDIVFLMEENKEINKEEAGRLKKIFLKH